ncbi:MAG: M36 family metallopeptidase [Acidobacteriota bacterium]
MLQMKRPSGTLVSILVLAFVLQLPLVATPAGRTQLEAAVLSHFEPLPNFDARDLRPPIKPTTKLETRKHSLAVKAAIDEVVVTWDDKLDLPHSLLSLKAALTARSTGDAALIARRFVRDNSSLFAISEGQLESARISARETDGRDGFTRLVLEQQSGGIRVFDSEMLFIIDREGRVRSESGSFIPQIDLLAPDSSPALAPEQALQRAAHFCGADITDVVAAVTDNSRGRLRVLFSSEAVDPRSEASLVYYPVTRDEVRLAYQIMLYGVPSKLDAYLLLVDAHSGELLRRDSLTYAADAPAGRVFTKENPTISTDREMVAFKGDPAASSAGWVTANRTAGNNAQIFFNPALDGGNTVKANHDGNFDFDIDLTRGRSPLDSSAASAANLFYWVNVAHDRFYSLGFNEASRNFQLDNLSKGGRDGDAVRAETLRGAGLDPASTNQLVRNNAFFQTGIDGTPPLLAMLMWTGSINGQSVELDSSYDAGVIIHEYTHGVSTRLAGTDNSTGLRSNQGGGMGEGWSDFFAASFLTGDLPRDGAYPVGSYITQLVRGVRNFPYSTRFDIDPLTFGDIRSYTEVHAQGTVWCSMLWDMRQAFVERYGFQTGKEAVERLVISGLKATPLAPTFVDARDAILLADRITNNGANQDLIWRAFARRGLGKSATAALATPVSGFRIAATEGYDVPAELSAGSLIINDKPSTPAVIGELLPLVVLDRDLTSSSIEVLATNLRTGANATFTLASGLPGRYAGTLRCLFPGQDGGPGAALAVVPGDPISVAYSNARNEAGKAETIEVRTLAGRRVQVYAADFEQGAADWSLTSFWHLTERRAAGGSRSLYFAKQKGSNEAKSFTPLGSSGSAFSPAAGLHSLSGARLEFDYAFVGLQPGGPTSSAGDLFTLNARNSPFIGSSPLSAEDPRLFVFFDLRGEGSAVFHPVSIDLRFLGSGSAYLGLSFFASTADIARKKLEGFYIDNIRVTAVSTK